LLVFRYFLRSIAFSRELFMQSVVQGLSPTLAALFFNFTQKSLSYILSEKPEFLLCRHTRKIKVTLIYTY
jgi:hypothetical protein